MKTLDEALDLLSDRKGHPGDVFDKHKALMDDIIASPRIDKLLRTGAGKDWSAEKFAVYAFFSGLVVGIEMEKHE